MAFCYFAKHFTSNFVYCKYINLMKFITTTTIKYNKSIECGQYFVKDRSYQIGFEYIPMLCWLCCNTEPKAIKSLAGVRLSDCGYPSPKYDASATALGGAFDISVKIVLDLTWKCVARRVNLFSCNYYFSSLLYSRSHYSRVLFSFYSFFHTTSSNIKW